MPRVPRWGIHKQIKYSPRRSLLKICQQCDKLFLQYNQGKRLYCSGICWANARREQKRIVNERIVKKRDKFRHREIERISYAQGLRSKPISKPGFESVPRPKIGKDGKIDWEGYRKSLEHKMKVTGMTTLL